MLKTDESKFIASKKDEIQGPLTFDVMGIYPLSTLPPQATLISSIWNNRQKQRLMASCSNTNPDYSLLESSRTLAVTIGKCMPQ
jgi:hypothetical protein